MTLKGHKNHYNVKVLRGYAGQGNTAIKGVDKKGVSSPELGIQDHNFEDGVVCWGHIAVHSELIRGGVIYVACCML